MPAPGSDASWAGIERTARPARPLVTREAPPGESCRVAAGRMWSGINHGECVRRPSRRIPARAGIFPIFRPGASEVSWLRELTLGPDDDATPPRDAGLLESRRGPWPGKDAEAIRPQASSRQVENRIVSSDADQAARYRAGADDP